MIVLLFIKSGLGDRQGVGLPENLVMFREFPKIIKMNLLINFNKSHLVILYQISKE